MRFRAWVLAPLLCALGSLGAGAAAVCAWGLGAAGCRCCVRLGAWALEPLLGSVPLQCAPGAAAKVFLLSGVYAAVV